MRLMGAVLLFFLCFGSALAKKYVEPTGASAGLRIVLVNPESYSVHIAEYDVATCRRGGDVGWVSGGRKVDTVRIGMPGEEAPREGILERRIPVGRPFSFGTRFIMPKQSIAQSLMGATNPGGASAEALANAHAAICEAPVFMPEAGVFYELTLALSPQRCEATLSRLKPTADGLSQGDVLITDRIRFPVSPDKPVCPKPRE